MLLKLFLLFTVISSLYAIKDWRFGIYLMILVGIVKDPIRKMIPGAPAYLALATVPIWGAICVGAIIEDPKLLKNFIKQYKSLAVAIFIFFLSILPAAVKSATYSSGSWQITVLGFFSYISVLLGLYLGYIFIRKPIDLLKLLKFYCGVTAIMFLGTPAEYLGFAKGWSALGTTAMGNEWLHFAVPGVIINMISGFYRSPDVMGWHSTALSILSIILAINSTGHRKYFWIALAACGIVGSILCGRRKMFFMLPVFITVFTFIYYGISKRTRATSIAMVVIISSLSGVYLYNKIGSNTAIEKYYFQQPDVVFGRIGRHGFDAVITTYKQSGFFGEGLGTATQGRHNIQAASPRTWQEGGLSRIMVEMGLPGLICFLYLVIILFMTFWMNIINNPLYYNSPDFSIRAGLFSFIIANSISFVVSHQIFGDPLIICFVAILTGSILSIPHIDQPPPEQIKKSRIQSQHSASRDQILNYKNTDQIKTGLLKT